ncbi:MAG: hypothetical protein B5766_00045 [Candidatus Lumbricidophila eiseniae]|uniref:Uncharacterized protein n=1 Tax=Candidatus Lumbricidiphila eiseniae TaxID=1969409 RepID=A0A2A6FV71_9MICO|nr:MAG: hypothetical protein B5766_00045 [Candidatus Lumbricidophila eiseniae]
MNPNPNPYASDALCPPWCAMPHGPGRSADRYHQTEPESAPGVFRRLSFDSESGAETATERLVVAARSFDGDDEVWVSIASEYTEIEMTLESSKRLLKLLGKVHVGLAGDEAPAPVRLLAPLDSGGRREQFGDLDAERLSDPHQ